MKILLTGGSSPIGSALDEILLASVKDLELYRPSHSELDLVKDFDVMSLDRFDYVIHCAGVPGFSENDHVLYKNLAMYYNLKKYCELYNSKLIVISSGALYDSQSRSLEKVKESEICNVLPVEEYGLAKNIIARDSFDNENIINLVVFGAFGEGEKVDRRFISRSILRTIYGLPIIINKDRDMSYVSFGFLGGVVLDIIEKKNSDMFGDVHGCYNVVGSETYSLRHIAEIISEISNKYNLNPRIIELDKEKEKSYTGSNEKLFNLTGKDYNRLYDDIKLRFEDLWFNKDKYDIRSVL